MTSRPCRSDRSDGIYAGLPGGDSWVSRVTETQTFTQIAGVDMWRHLRCAGRVAADATGVVGDDGAIAEPGRQGAETDGFHRRTEHDQRRPGVRVAVEVVGDLFLTGAQGAEWNGTGNLKDWAVTERLGELALPVLVTTSVGDCGQPVGRRYPRR